jgi:hypothetical protein
MQIYLALQQVAMLKAKHDYLTVMTAMGVSKTTRCNTSITAVAISPVEGSREVVSRGQSRKSAAEGGGNFGQMLGIRCSDKVLVWTDGSRL